MGIRTGMGKGRPAQLERVSASNPLKNSIDTCKSLKQSIIDAVSQAELDTCKADFYDLMEKHLGIVKE
jgi:hypothetical protein